MSLLQKIFKILSFTLPLFLTAMASAVDLQILRLPHQADAVEMKLKAVLLKDTLWTQSDIESELKMTNAIFAQCGVQISEVQILRLDHSGTLATYEDFANIGQKLVNLGYRQPTELTLIFSNRFADPLLTEAGGSQSGGASLPHLSIEEDTENILKDAENLAFVMDISHTEEYHKYRDPNYTPLAHELGHIILNTDHVDYPNLMSYRFDWVNASLTASQCSLIIASPLIRSSF